MPAKATYFQERRITSSFVRIPPSASAGSSSLRISIPTCFRPPAHNSIFLFDFAKMGILGFFGFNATPKQCIRRRGPELIECTAEDQEIAGESNCWVEFGSEYGEVFFHLPTMASTISLTTVFLLLLDAVNTQLFGLPGLGGGLPGLGGGLSGLSGLTGGGLPGLPGSLPGIPGFPGIPQVTIPPIKIPGIDDILGKPDEKKNEEKKEEKPKEEKPKEEKPKEETKPPVEMSEEEEKPPKKEEKMPGTKDEKKPSKKEQNEDGKPEQKPKSDEKSKEDKKKEKPPGFRKSQI
ncbi:hypothetical protein L596_012079 [Steinernema carpocapsae]|uniref:Uncharacterized protein n=1 Tax=Steinernema carpocapsae TaxID=34508 RepID=A0A4U5NW78_STECR|nr:hypothetical protein L596_012079 [Steinernema carpocapsae]